MHRGTPGPSLLTKDPGGTVKSERAKGGSDCALCDAHEKGAEQHETHARARPEAVIPWVALVVLSFAVPPFLGEADRVVAFGLCGALAAGAGLAWLTHRMNMRITEHMLEETTEELKTEADQRVSMVIRQFEWAVSDVTKLRDALKRAQDSQTETEANERRLQQRLRTLEVRIAQAGPKIDKRAKTNGAPHAAPEEPSTVPSIGEQLIVPLTWRVFEDNKLPWLRLESAGIIPSQVRILNEVGRVITTGAPAADASMNGTQVALAMRAPDNVVATLEGRSADRFKFEALVGDVWCAVQLKAAARSATNGATNGATHGATNGSTNGALHGATNGGTHSATNGVPHADSNGGTHGATNGATKETNGSNGSSNWRPADDSHPQALIA